MPIPANSPHVSQTLICDTCSRTMRREIKSQANGKLVAIRHFCDTCKYGWDSNLYSIGMHSKYEPAKVAAPGGKTLPPPPNSEAGTTIVNNVTKSSDKDGPLTLKGSGDQQ